MNAIAKKVEGHLLQSSHNYTLADYKGMVMVRSTGIEDSAEIANPGGNESHPANNNSESIKKAIAKVVSSYFKPKSLSQCLASKGKYPDEMFMPVLMQQMIGENQNDPIEKKETKYYDHITSMAKICFRSSFKMVFDRKKR
jgi:hypothetical protein